MSPTNYHLKKKLAVLLPALNERQRRLLLGAEAIALGYGGINLLAEMTGVSQHTIRRGIHDVESNDITGERIRKNGAGRKKLVVDTPQIRELIEQVVEPDARGDPETPLRWTCKSVRNIADFLGGEGFVIGRQTVANILHEMEFSLQGNRKTKEGDDHPDRDKQFRFISRTTKRFLAQKNPAISVDTKKKELVGQYKNIGREWQYKGTPVDVNGHDFPNPEVPKAIPYGIYDLANNAGWVNVGITADTAEFAVSSIRYWWAHVGAKKYSRSRRLLICADAGGSNGYRSHLWKREMQRFADSSRLEVSVCHFPPGTSKWNKIEHRLFSFISMNWRGKPLSTYQVVINLIAATTTRSGLTVKARLDKRRYKKGIKISKSEIASLNIAKNTFHGEWNYTIKPRS